MGLAVVLAVSLAIAPLTAEAQPAGKVARIGCLVGTAREQTSGLVNAFEDGLRDLGYVPGQNVVIHARTEYRLTRLWACACMLS